jgi:hypothetical protein
VPPRLTAPPHPLLHPQEEDVDSLAKRLGAPKDKDGQEHHLTWCLLGAASSLLGSVAKAYGSYK